jgi:nucleoside triphosphatase
MAEPNLGTTQPTIAVGVLIIDMAGLVMVGRFPKWSGKWCVFGGKLERGETVEACARREVKEETGLDVDTLSFFRIYESIDDPDFYKPVHFLFVNYVCRASNTKVKLNEETTDFVWLEPSQVLELDLNRSTRAFVGDYLAQTHSDSQLKMRLR